MLAPMQKRTLARILQGTRTSSASSLAHTSLRAAACPFEVYSHSNIPPTYPHAHTPTRGVYIRCFHIHAQACAHTTDPAISNTSGRGDSQHTRQKHKTDPFGRESTQATHCAAADVGSPGVVVEETVKHELETGGEGA